MTDGLGLGDAYGATIDRIMAQGGEKARLGMAALMWISRSERPLKVNELCHALSVEIGSPNLDADNVPSMGLLLACCQGLVAVEKEASTVRLIHFTVQEYLRAHPGLFGSAHSTMAETCLSYLNSHQVKALSVNPVSDLKDSDFQATPFLEYSSLYWGIHAKRELSNRAKMLALKLFDDCNSHISTKILLEADEMYRFAVDFGNPSLFSGLHCASFFGIVEIVACLLAVEGCDINQEGHIGNTPLAWAAFNGHEGVVEILLGRDDVNPDQPNNLGHTPLLCASWNGHEGVVEILLRRADVKSDKSDCLGRTPLSWATIHGHERVVKALLRRGGVNPDKQDRGGWTPLQYASELGRAGVVALLQPLASPP